MTIPERNVIHAQPKRGKMRLGLRFSIHDVLLLRQYADRVKLGELADSASLYEYAADAAEKQEPLIVECESADEVHAMMAMFRMVGCHEPNLVELNGEAR